MVAVDSTPTFTQPKVLEKVFLLPIVTDSYSYGLDTMSSLTSSLHPYLSSLASPYLSSSLASLPPLLSSLQALAKERLPGVVTSKLCTARDQVTGGVQYLDSTLCSGLDQLLVKVPALTSPTPALYSSTREAAMSQLTLATTYLASFTLAQLALKASDSGLEMTENLLKLAPASYSSRCEHIVSGLKTVRGQVEQVRREGVRVNGTQKVASMESSSLLSAVSEVFGLNYVLDIVGLAKIFAKASAPGEVSEEVVPEISEAAVEVLNEDLGEIVEAASKIIDIVGLAKIFAKASAPGEVSEEVVPEISEAAVELLNEDVGEIVEAASKRDVPNEVEAAFEVVKEVMKAEAAAAVEGVERGVFGAAPVQREGKNGKMSFMN